MFAEIGTGQLKTYDAAKSYEFPGSCKRDDRKMKSQGMPFWSWPGCSLSWSKEASAWGRGRRGECSIDFHSGLETPVFIACALTFLADCNLWFLNWFSWNKQLVTHMPAERPESHQGAGWGGDGRRGGLEPFPLHSLPDRLHTAPVSHREMVEGLEMRNRLMVYICVSSHSDIHGHFLRLASFSLTSGTTCLVARQQKSPVCSTELKG